MDKASLAALRKQVKQQQRNAGRKISRMRSNGVEIGGTTLDPRREPKRIDKYNANQLNALSNRLNAFNDRSHGYVAMKDGVATRQEWAAYRQQQTRLNAAKRREFNKVKDVHIDPLGITFGEMQTWYKSDHKTMGTSMNDPFRELDRKPQHIDSPKKLRALTKKMAETNDEGFRKIVIADARKQTRQMAKESGLDNVIKDLDKLDDDQFFTLYATKGFMDGLSAHYITRKINKGYEDNPDLDPYAPGGGLVHVDASELESPVNEFIAWARRLK